jgi:hypothetical protein
MKVCPWNTECDKCGKLILRGEKVHETQDTIGTHKGEDGKTRHRWRVKYTCLACMARRKEGEG